MSPTFDLGLFSGPLPTLDNVENTGEPWMAFSKARMMRSERLKVDVRPEAEEEDAVVRRAREEEDSVDSTLSPTSADVNAEGVLDIKKNVLGEPAVESILQSEAEARRRNLSEGELEMEGKFGRKKEGGKRGGLGAEEELRLGRVIQSGVRILKVKQEIESFNNGLLNWAEMTKRTGMKRSEVRKTVSQYRSAKNKLVTSNLPLVHAVVRTTYKPTGARTYQDLIQEGSTGLLRAAELYDPEKGLRFSTYAVVWIKGVLGNSRVSETITVPLRERTKINKIRKFVLEYEGSHEGRHPRYSEISEGTGMSESEVVDVMSKVRDAGRLLSIDYIHESKNGGVQGVMLDKNMWADVEMGEVVGVKADVLKMLIEQLSERERRLIVLRYGLDGGGERSLEVVGKEMGLSKERVRVLNIEVVKKLKKVKEIEGMEEYLLTIA